MEEAVEVEAMEGLRAGDGARPAEGPYRDAAAEDAPRMSEVEREVPGRRRTVDSLCSTWVVFPFARPSGVVCSTLRDDDFDFCFGIVCNA